MQIHQVKPIHKSQKKKRIGRGGVKGHFSGRGMKGQKSRAGRKMQPFIRELIKKYKKLRGYKMKSRKKKQIGINLGFLNKKFRAGDLINPAILVQKKIVRRQEGKVPEIKILSQGKLQKKFIFQGCSFSKKAEEKIKEQKGIIKS